MLWQDAASVLDAFDKDIAYPSSLSAYVLGTEWELYSVNELFLRKGNLRKKVSSLIEVV